MERFYSVNINTLDSNPQNDQDRWVYLENKSVWVDLMLDDGYSEEELEHIKRIYACSMSA